MIISKEKKFIYLAVPKTGTTSVQKYLLENDKTATKNSVEINGKYHKFREHMTAFKIKSLLGVNYQNFSIIGFVRHPYGRIVSSYFFYKKGGKEAWRGKQEQRSLGDKLRIKSTEILPFKIWALVYPYKSNKEYFIDESDNLIVDLKNIGLFENLGDDLKDILFKSRITLKNEISHENKSNHGYEDEYFKNPVFKWLINRKVKRDLEFYNLVLSRKQL